MHFVYVGQIDESVSDIVSVGLTCREWTGLHDLQIHNQKGKKEVNTFDTELNKL